MTSGASIDPERLAVCLSVLAEAERLPVEHPDAVAVRRATAGLFKTAKLQRRRDRRNAVLSADRAVTEATATGAPGRIDDETAGIRAKIGMYIALRLLRDGADLTITTRFPHDAVRRFTAMPDSADWLHRLRVVGLDLRDPAQVVGLAESVTARGPLDILINNAAQTVRRSPGAYAAIAAAEQEPLPAGPLPELEYFGSAGTSPAAALTSGTPVLTPQQITEMALTARSVAIDAGGLVPDTAPTNSWSDRVHEVDPLELLEVQLCNVTAPFILVSRVRTAMTRSPFPRRYVVNVSAMEGVFSRGYKGAGHPHTNMAKAALNMLTRTSAVDLCADGILMTSVDTGWITDERPHPTKMRLADEGFHAPLDLVDGAARVYDPIVRGEHGEDLYGCFLKDYAAVAW